MAKNRVTKRELRIPLTEAGFNAAVKAVGTPLGDEAGFLQKEIGNDFAAVSIGRRPKPPEYEGEGLPPVNDEVRLFQDWNLEIDIRLDHDGNNSLNLLVAVKGTGSYFKFPLTDINWSQARLTAYEFEPIFRYTLVNDILNLFFACSGKQNESREKRDEMYEAIINSLEIRFKDLLKWDRYKPKEKTIENGIEITTKVIEERGAPTKLEAEKEKEKREFLEELFYGFTEFRKRFRRKKLTQKGLTPYIYTHYKHPEKKISDVLKEHNLDFDELRQKFLSNPNKEEFLSAVITANKITDN